VLLRVTSSMESPQTMTRPSRSKTAPWWSRGDVEANRSPSTADRIPEFDGSGIVPAEDHYLSVGKQCCRMLSSGKVQVTGQGDAHIRDTVVLVLKVP